MKKLSLLFVLSLVILLAACGADKASKESKTATKGEKAETTDTVEIKSNYMVSGEKEDGSDAEEVSETVVVPKNPKSVAVFDYGALSTINEIGGADAVKGLPMGEGKQSVPSFLEQFKDDKYVNLGSLKEANFEKLAEMQPEVIFISGRMANKKTIDEMHKAAPDAKIVYVGTNDKDYIGSVKENTENLGKIFDKESEAKKLVEDLDKKIEEVKAVAEKSKDKALFILANEGELSVFGKGGRFGFIHDVLGVKEADANIKAEGHGQVINYEYLNKTNPDIIYAMDRGVAVGGKSSSKQALSNDVIKNVNAVKNDKIVEVDPYLWYFSSGGAKTTMQQIDEVAKGFK